MSETAEKLKLQLSRLSTKERAELAHFLIDSLDEAIDDDVKVLSLEEVAKRARELYNSRIREQVEQEENIGKMVIIDIETGEYGVDETGLESSRKLQAKNANAQLFGLRIGYNVAASLGGVMERVYK
jgi:Putative addiction module component